MTLDDLLNGIDSLNRMLLSPSQPLALKEQALKRYEIYISQLEGYDNPVLVGIYRDELAEHTERVERLRRGYS